ncbi:unnamed protein product [Lathyrus sativus]|nr:unnamed protein product [Lathyrus sativus]
METKDSDANGSSNAVRILHAKRQYRTILDLTCVSSVFSQLDSAFLKLSTGSAVWLPEEVLKHNYHEVPP